MELIFLEKKCIQLKGKNDQFNGKNFIHKRRNGKKKKTNMVLLFVIGLNLSLKRTYLKIYNEGLRDVFYFYLIFPLIAEYIFL